METKKLYLARTQQVIAPQLTEAITFIDRLVGLLGKKSLPNEQALWIHRCGDIHTCFMKFPIDVLFLSKNKKVLKVVHSLPPWRFSFKWNAHSVIEFNAGALKPFNIQLGDEVYVDH